MKRLLLIPLMAILLAASAFALISYEAVIDCSGCSINYGDPATFDVNITNNSAAVIDVTADVDFAGNPYSGSAPNIPANGGTDQITITIPAADIAQSESFEVNLTATAGAETKTKTLYGAISVRKETGVPEIPPELAGLFAALIAASALIILNKK